MKIIKVGKTISQIKRLTCSHCESIFEFTKDECKHTSQLGMMHDNLGAYNIDCPVCGATRYFDWR